MTSSRTLVLETSTPQASLALVTEPGGLEEREFASDRNHNSLLFGPLKELLTAGSGMERILVGSGPGSYSGTRVGIAAAQGVAIAHGCEAVAVPSVLAVPAAANGDACLVIGDARRGGYWTARVEAWQMASGPELTDAAGLATAIENASRQGMVIVTFEEPERFPLPESIASVVRREFPSAARLWRAWSKADAATQAAWAALPLQPLYLKPPHITLAKSPWRVPG